MRGLTSSLHGAIAALAGDLEAARPLISLMPQFRRTTNDAQDR